MRQLICSYGPGVVIIIISFIIAILYIVIASERDLTILEIILFQIFILAASISGSVLFGKSLERKEIAALIKPYARPAFRRVLSLYDGLSRIANKIEFEHKNSSVDSKNVLYLLSAIVYEQICTVDDAMEDWRDIIPEDVAELEKNKLKKALARRRDNFTSRGDHGEG